jgi:hypothetical protein
MLVTLTSAWGAAKELGTAVQAIGSIVGKLRAKPDVAATELVRVLDEVAMTHHAVDEAILRYLAIVDDPTAFTQGSRALLELEGGALAADVEAGRGHCHDIRRIYDSCLRSWFDRVLDPTEQVLMKGTFDALGNADEVLFRDLASVADVLDEGAGEAINMLRAGDPNGARARIGRDFDELRKLRAEMSKTKKSLRTMRIDFDDLVRGTPGT